MGNSSNIQHFGSSWTEEKLDIFSYYLNAYVVALKNRKFKKLYIDAFAGTGEIETDEGKLIVGSAKRALSATNKFDHYYFIEKSKRKTKELEDMIKREFPELLSNVTILNGDANSELHKLLDVIDWRFSRALLFLDPYATEVEWDTLTRISQTEAIDVWYLFPFSALNRLLKKDGKLDPKWSDCVDKLLGNQEWREKFYEKDPQLSLFNPEPVVKTVNTDSLTQYIIERLKTIFPSVSDNARVFRNKNNSPLFLFCFAVSNPSPKAQSLAMKIANQILQTL